MANVDILRSQDSYQGSIWHQNNVLSIITKYPLPLILENELKVIKINNEVTEASKYSQICSNTIDFML